MKIKIAPIIIVFTFVNLVAAGQTTSVKFGKGLNFVAKDSSLSLKLTFRFQTLFSARQTLTDEGKLADDYKSQFMIRRSRIKLDGFIYSPKLEYKVELALSNSDISNGVSTTDQSKFLYANNIVLDAILKWEFAKNTQLVVGQTKLPGNRERVISSQKLQFVDRSILNSAFNLDRDVGIHIRNETHVAGNLVLREILCVTMGEGRNVVATNDDGFCYTGRLEILPFGTFAHDGDYFASDLEREPKPKLAIGLTYDYNDDARRTRGQLGNFVHEDSLVRDLQSFHSDFMFKLRGFSMMGEYAKRFVADKDPSVYYVGSAFNLQAGYLFKNNVEFALRFSQLSPDKIDVSTGEVIHDDRSDQFTLGISKYFVKHSLKIQSDVSSTSIDHNLENNLMYRFQVEMQF